MAWKLCFSPGIEKDLRNCDRQVARYIIESLERFARDYSVRFEAELMKSGKIKALAGEWKSFYRLRLRSYRVIYKKNSDVLIILVVRIAHRKDIEPLSKVW
jgi:mRNA interferase RelE/StbE